MKKIISFISSVILCASFLIAAEPVQDSDYSTWETFKYVKSEFFGINTMIEYCCRTNENYTSEKNKWKGKAVTRSIYFVSYELGDGEKGSDEYIIPKEVKTVKLPYYSDAEKKEARNAIKEESLKKKEQSERLLLDKELNPNRIEYSIAGNADFSSMKILTDDEDSTFKVGSVYRALSLNKFRAEYSIKTDGLRFYFMTNGGGFGQRKYEFLLTNVNDYTDGDNLVRFLGIVDLQNGLGNVSYFYKWEIVKADSRIREVIKNNPLNYNDIKIEEDN